MDLFLLYSTKFSGFWQGTLRKSLGGGVPPRTLRNRSVHGSVYTGVCPIIYILSGRKLTVSSIPKTLAICLARLSASEMYFIGSESSLTIAANQN